MKTQDLPKRYDQSTPGIPHHLKKRTFAVLPGWLGLVIGSFVTAGRVVGLPRVPDARAGCAGGIPHRAGYVNIYKQSPESMPGALTCCWGHLAGVSGGVKA